VFLFLLLLITYCRLLLISLLGVPPEYGMVSAIVGGAAVSAFGGHKLTVSGPAAAMSLLV
jgi:MFS superfamily sulfate permease-like transporter